MTKLSERLTYSARTAAADGDDEEADMLKQAATALDEAERALETAKSRFMLIAVGTSRRVADPNVGAAECEAALALLRAVPK
jgi:hypothetical protein